MKGRPLLDPVMLAGPGGIYPSMVVFYVSQRRTSLVHILHTRSVYQSYNMLHTSCFHKNVFIHQKFAPLSIYTHDKTGVEKVATIRTSKYFVYIAIPSKSKRF